jgi:hypothetical protein
MKRLTFNKTFGMELVPFGLLHIELYVFLSEGVQWRYSEWMYLSKVNFMIQ